MRRSQLQRRIAEAEASDDIIVYPNRRRLAGWIVAFGVLTFPCVLGTIGMLVLLVVYPNMRSDVAAFFLIILFGSFSALSIWQTRVFLRIASSREPILVISRAGVRVGKTYGPSDIFLPWEEIEAVYSGPPYKILAIRPVDNERLLARLQSGTRLVSRLNRFNGELIAIYQSFMDRPIAEILEQTHAHYARELELHLANAREEEVTDSSNEQQDITLYMPRWHLWASALTSLPSIFGILLPFYAPRQPSTFLISALFILGGIILGPVTTWKTLHTPLLLIDDEGIASPRFLKETKIKWEEIAAIFCVPGTSFFVDTSPSGTVALLARQQKGRLAIPRSMDITKPQTVLGIPQSMLPLPLDRLLVRIKTRFRDQLERYDMELHSL